MRKLFLLGVLLAPLWSFAQQSKVDSLKAVLATVKTDTAELRVLLDLCAQFQFLPRKDLLEYGQRAVKIAGNEHKQKELSFGWYFIAMSYYYEGKYDDAAQAAEKCVAIIRETGNKTSMLDALTLLGTIFNQKGDHGKALDAHFESLAISEQLNDEAGKAFAYNNIGTVYYNNNQQADALKYFRKALNSYAAVGDSLYMGIVYSNLGELHSDPDSSIHYLKLALGLLERFEYEDAIAHVAANLGEVYTGKRDWPQAEKYLYQAIDIWEKTGLASGLNSPYRTLGRINAYRGNLTEAMKWFDKALENAGGQSQGILKDTYMYMSVTFREIGQYKDALDYFSRADVLKDSLFNEEKAQQLVEAETRYNTNLLARQSAEKDLTIARQQNRQKNILIAAILVILVLGGGFQYLRHRERLRKNEAETALRIQQAEADKLREVDKMKSSFFANISHEFRTPLTLILGPLEECLSQASRNQHAPLRMEPADARMMQRNAKRLLELINQLLDLSRLEGGRLKLNVR
ncbi:MAG TPA: tetratricopeptide repeat protein, partial [Flavilitoribacter sp.]|nr:tetratricopeptide repeat protein [Flavilitoribacter sp.]